MEQKKYLNIYRKITDMEKVFLIYINNGLISKHSINPYNYKQQLNNMKGDFRRTDPND